MYVVGFNIQSTDYMSLRRRSS